uniref:SCAN domaincontaining protein 3like [Acyrthosiphon pisum] n=1 Tax=Lepeophtheirus salmonis TaxID=72036 RepID=A0A0K2V833_LEPSM
MVTKETRRISSSGRAQQLWDAIKAVRLQKQIPAITRMGRYMSRYYQLKKDETQRLLDLAVEDNLIKLETKIGTKGTKSGIEEKAYRLPTSDMLPRERHDWYCFKCHAGGEVVLCATCHRVYHEDCIKSPDFIPSEEYVCKYCEQSKYSLQ